MTMKYMLVQKRSSILKSFFYYLIPVESWNSDTKHMTKEVNMNTIKTLFLGIEFSFLPLQKTKKDLFDNAIDRILPMHLLPFG